MRECFATVDQRVRATDSAIGATARPQVGAVSDRRTANEWEASGGENVYQLAHEKVKAILSSHYPKYIETNVDAAIRERFPIKLAPDDMKRGNGRWED